MTSTARPRGGSRRQEKDAVPTPIASDEREDTDLINTTPRDENRDSDDGDDTSGKGIDSEDGGHKSTNEVLSLLRTIDSKKLLALLHSGALNDEIAEEAKKRKITNKVVRGQLWQNV